MLIPLSIGSLMIAIAFWLCRIGRALETLRNVPRVPIQTPPSRERLPSLTLVIPARNEEKNLPACLQSLEPQLNSNIQCLVINDRSTDRTEALLVAAGYRLHTAETPLLKKNYVNLTQTPPAGWTGKNNALSAVSQELKTEWLLFTDADTLHQPQGIASALAYAVKHQIELLTLTPQCITETPLERLIQPTAMGLMGLWFPLSHANDPRKKEHFANGQFLLIQTQLYERLGGHKGVKDCFLEDFALMRRAKEIGAKAVCALGQDLYGTRMYQTPQEIWRGWRRIYLHACERSPARLSKQAFELFAASIFPLFIIAEIPLLFYREPVPLQGLAVSLALIWLFIMTMTSLETYKTLRAPRRYALLHPLAAIIVTGILLDALRTALFKIQTKWRG